jgi:hypothetical protein
MLQGYGDAVLRAETLEDQLVKSRKHATAMQSKLDTAFAMYHNDIQEMQEKSDDLVWKNKSLRNKNKGTPLVLLSTYWRSRGSLTRCRMDLPGPTISVGTRTDYSVGPWDYPACAARHLKAWSTRTAQE